MKITIADIPSRIRVRKVKTEGILAYDIDNAYPQRMMRLVGGSGTARNCVNLYGKFIKGTGLENTDLGAMIINRDKITMNGLLKDTSEDFAQNGGWAVHVNYNLLFEKTSCTIIPFETARLSMPDGYEDGNQQITHIALYNDWAREHSRQIKKKNIKRVHIFNDDPEIIAQQIEEAGGIQNYKGQVFWFSNQGPNSYPLPIYDPVLEDIDTDAQLKIYRNSNVRTGFSASHLFIHKGKFESQADRDEFNALIAEFQGPDVAGSMMVIEAEHEEQVPELIEVKSQVADKVVNITTRNVKDSIIETFGTPSILVNADTGTGVTFSNDLMKLAYDYYNTITESERVTMMEEFTKLFANFHEPITGEFNITPMVWAGESTPTPSE